MRYRRGRAAVVFSFLPEGYRAFAGGMDSTCRRGDLVPLSRSCARAHPDALIVSRLKGRVRADLVNYTRSREACNCGCACILVKKIYMIT